MISHNVCVCERVACSAYKQPVALQLALQHVQQLQTTAVTATSILLLLLQSGYGVANG
jgi:hypothetical protein